jgi:uroporphyrinogen-III synthase
MRVIITRPIEDAGPMAEGISARGHEPVFAPLSHIRYQTPEPPPGQPAATIFTSKNAIRALEDVAWAKSLHRLPAYCVGAATAEAARQAGFLHVVAGGGTGAQLAEHIAWMHRPGSAPLLYLTGEHLAFDMQQTLAARGLTVWRRIVYHNALVQSLSLPVTVGLQKDFFDAIIFMSPRTARHFVHLAENAGVGDHAARLRFLCLSDQIAAALAPLQPEHVAVAARPSQDALLDLLGPRKPA